MEFIFPRRTDSLEPIIEGTGKGALEPSAAKELPEETTTVPAETAERAEV
jgi:hypothetical protein